MFQNLAKIAAIVGTVVGVIYLLAGFLGYKLPEGNRIASPDVNFTIKKEIIVDSETAREALCPNAPKAPISCPSEKVAPEPVLQISKEDVSRAAKIEEPKQEIPKSNFDSNAKLYDGELTDEGISVAQNFEELELNKNFAPRSDQSQLEFEISKTKPET